MRRGDVVVGAQFREVGEDVIRPFGQRELEAESVAFIVCKRNGVSSKSETYLKTFVDQNTTADNLDIYRILSAAGQIETLLGLGARTAFERPAKGTR